jgi:hypothetical protein
VSKYTLPHTPLLWHLGLLAQNPFELLKRPEFQLNIVLIAKKEACSSPLEAFENLVDYPLERIDQCQAQQEHVTALLYFC